MANGIREPQSQEPQARRDHYPVMGPETPLAVYTPVAITATTIKWFLGTIAGTIAVLAASPIADRYMMPAKDSDLQNVIAIVETLRTEQAKNRDVIARLTVAVDNLSGVVDQIKPLTKGKVLRR